jgi:predicted transcriptional regulator
MVDPRIGRSRIPEHLYRLGMSQAEFTSKLNISESMVSKLISGEKLFSLFRCKQSADIIK